MRNKYILNKLIESLWNLQESDLRKLAAILANPEGNEALLKLIEGTLAFRSAARKSRFDVIHEKAQPNREEVRAREGKVITQNRLNIESLSINDIRNQFKLFLSDKKILPSTKDVVEAVNSAFNFGIEYNNYYKRGRRDLIQRCMRELGYLPQKQQLKLMKSFFSQVSEKYNGVDAYQKLFRILAVDE